LDQLFQENPLCLR